MVYSHAPFINPWSVLKGEDEQDQEDLAVPSEPVYIQEKISPKAIVGANLSV